MAQTAELWNARGRSLALTSGGRSIWIRRSRTLSVERPHISIVLFHVSEHAGIDRFEPRVLETFPEPVVWAVDREHLRNYLLPRDCPRVTYYRIPTSTAEDVAKYLGASPAVVAIESEWLPRIRDHTLYCYSMPSTTFECIDPGAGYYISRQSVTPDAIKVIRDPIGALRASGAELRTVDNLWPLHDAVATSSLQFSMIRMRNAKPLTI